MVIYENIDISSFPIDTWTVIADIGWSNQIGHNHTGNFQTVSTDDRFRVNANGQLGAMRRGVNMGVGYYGYIIYPTAD